MIYLHWYASHLIAALELCDIPSPEFYYCLVLFNNTQTLTYKSVLLAPDSNHYLV
jgi:hypothetical protein